MSDSSITFLSGDFSSGTTLLYTLFRNTEDTYCLYEPLHEQLLHYLVRPPRTYEGHAFVGSYFAEYKGFAALRELFDPRWSTSRLHLAPNEEAPELRRYLTYLIGTAYGRRPRVVLKENRFSFRLGWLRTTFPDAKIVHVFRDCDEHWNSIVRRAQKYVGREDVGQHGADFKGFLQNVRCDDLASSYPGLAAERSSSGFERFQKLWEHSLREHQHWADVSIELGTLKSDFVNSCERISAAVGYQLDAERLQRFVASDGAPRPRQRLPRNVTTLVDRAGARYAEARVRAQLGRRDRKAKAGRR